MCVMQWLRVKVMSVIQPKGSTPLPGGVMLALFMSMFGNAIAMQMLFAFLPDMVKSFGIADEDVGYYVGILASAVFFGRFISSYFWGWISDKIGRRMVLLWTTGSLGFATVAFGFSKSFKVALVIRFISGLVAGIPGTVKASLTDICDETNQALGMSIVVTSWNTGLIIGPAVGGYLAKPAAKYALFKGNAFFENFAYLFPCLVNAAINFVSFLLIFFILPETLASKRKAKRKEVLPVAAAVISVEETVDTSQNSIPLKRQRPGPKSTRSLDAIPNGSLCKSHNEDATMEIEKSLSDLQILSGSVSILPDLNLHNYPHSSGSMLDSPDKAETEPYFPPDGKSKPGLVRKTYRALIRSKLAKLCRNKDVRYCVGLYTVFSFAVVAEHEMYSVWAATGKRLGGLDFDTNDLGFTLMVVGFGCALTNCIVYPKFVAVFGLMQAQFISLIGAMFFTIILPATNILYGRGMILKSTIIVIVLLMRIAQGCSFTGQFIFLGNSVTSNLRATVHGFAMTMVCAARTVSPMVTGSLYSWSITSGLGFPFNEKCVFIFIGFVFWLSLLVACCLDREAVTKQGTK